MKLPADQSYQLLQTKVHGLALGMTISMTLGLGSMYLGQICPAAGQ